MGKFLWHSEFLMTEKLKMLQSWLDAGIAELCLPFFSYLAGGNFLSACTVYGGWWLAETAF